MEDDARAPDADEALRQRDAALEEAGTARADLAAVEEDRVHGRLLLALSEALMPTTTVEQVSATITDVVRAELGARGGGLLLADAARTRLDFVSMERMPVETDGLWRSIAWGADAPLAAAVRTRRGSFHPDTAAILRAHPTITTQAVVPDVGASASLPLVVGDDVLGAVVLYWDRSYRVGDHERSALEAFARYCAQAVQRAQLLAERRSTAEVLQRSLLTELPQPDHLEIRARYVPAAIGQEVGGDWYDALVSPDGATTLVIGDVTGHDMAAAARMGQMRGLLRAYAFDRPDEPPHELVSRLDRAVVGLDVDGLATLVVARLEQGPADAEAGLRRLRWSSAGHLPPLMLHDDRTTEVLDSRPELLVGLAPGARRSDHTREVPPGSTVLLYTDGLVEHRGRSITDGVEDLRRALAASADLTLDEMLDRLVEELVGEDPEDDCALLAVRAHPEDRPRPPEAGPGSSA